MIGLKKSRYVLKTPIPIDLAPNAMEQEMEVSITW